MYFSPLVLLVGEEDHNQTDLVILGENGNSSEAAGILGKLYRFVNQTITDTFKFRDIYQDLCQWRDHGREIPSGGYCR